jgi:hypothetical protein
MDRVALIRQVIGPADGELNNLDVFKDKAGAVWASNRYWIVPAQQIAPLMDRYNLSCEAPGRYLVDKSSVGKLDACGTDRSRLMHLARFPVPLERAEIDGYPLFIHLDDMRIAVLTAPDGSHIGVHEKYLDWTLGDGIYKHLVWDGFDGGTIGVTEDQREKVRDAHYELDGEDIGSEGPAGAVFVAAEYRVKETRLVAVVAQFRLMCKHVPAAAADGGES